MTRRASVYLAGVVLGLLSIAWMLGLGEWVRTRRAHANPPAKTVLFVVLDTVRADHLSACGYTRPTSPTLERLAAEGALSCDAYAPGSWTFPSHASYFTGRPVWDHGAHFVGDGALIRKLSIRPLSDEHPTLAEHHRERGYQTAGLSGNPVLQPESGLNRGFDSWRAPSQFGPWYGDAFLRELKDVLRSDLDPERPLFLFLNIADAHDPWFGVPEGLDWVEPRDEVRTYFRVDDDGDVLRGDWARYVLGEMEREEQQAFLTGLRDQYDYGVFRADDTLGRALEVLDDHGWTEDVRIVVVSDHGEFLGEHQLLRHGRYLYEENQRVPLLVVGADEDIQFPSPVSATAVHGLVLDGVYKHFPVEAVAFPDRAWMEFSGGEVGGSTSAAIWSSEGQQLWMDDSVIEGAASEELDELVRRTKESAAREALMDPQLEKALEAAGYL